MGKCVGKYKKVVHYDGAGGQSEIYDKFGNLIGGDFQNMELIYGNRKLFISKKIQVSAGNDD